MRSHVGVVSKGNVQSEAFIPHPKVALIKSMGRLTKPFL